MHERIETSGIAFQVAMRYLCVGDPTAPPIPDEDSRTITAASTYDRELYRYRNSDLEHASSIYTCGQQSHATGESAARWAWRLPVIF